MIMFAASVVISDDHLIVVNSGGDRSSWQDTSRSIEFLDRPVFAADESSKLLPNRRRACHNPVVVDGLCTGASGVSWSAERTDASVGGPNKGCCQTGSIQEIVSGYI